MDLSTFQSFVQERAGLFDGVHPESTGSLDGAESRLGFRLPTTLRWLLQEWGYSDCCGIASLDDAVSVTLLCRDKFGLPQRYFVLNDWGDAGVVYLDTVTGWVRWADGGELYQLAEGRIPTDRVDTFDDFPAWVASRVETFEEEFPNATENT